PTFLSQMRANPNGPLALPLPTDGNTVNWLVSLVTSSGGALLVLPFIFGKGLVLIRRYASALLLVVLWLLLTPVALLALNDWFAPVYQVRYSIALLPAGALLAAYGIRNIGLPDRLWQRTGGLMRYAAPLQIIAGVILLVLLVSNQLSVYGYFW